MILLILGTISVLFLFLKIWNRLSRRYNNNIIAKSNCTNCGSIIGNQPIANAVKKWEIEKQKIIKESKTGTILLRNLDFICEKCGTSNSEQKIYKRNREKNKKE